MKHFEIKIEFKVSDEYYQTDEFQDLKNSILSGEFQREISSGQKNKAGMKNFTATIQELKK